MCKARLYITCSITRSYFIYCRQKILILYFFNIILLSLSAQRDSFLLYLFRLIPEPLAHEGTTLEYDGTALRGRTVVRLYWLKYVAFQIEFTKHMQLIFELISF